MPTYYPTGRTRTYVVSGDIVTRWRGGEDAITPYEYKSHFTITCNGASVSFSASNFFTDVDPGGSIVAAFHHYSATANGPTGTNSATTNVSKVDSPDVDYEIDLTGNYAFTFEVEEVFWVEDVTVEVDADGFPNYGGPAQKDGPKARIIRFGERLVIDSETTVELNIGPYSISDTHTVTSAVIIDHAVAISGASYIFYGPTDDEDQVVEITVDFPDGPVGCPYVVTQTSDHLNHKVECTNGLYVLFNQFTPPPAPAQNYTAGQVTLYAPRRYELAARQRLITGPVDDQILWRIQDKNGSIITTSNGGLSWEQEKYSASASFNGSAQTPLNVDEFTPVWVALDRTDLVAKGEDDRDWRCLILGKKWDCFKIEHNDDGLTNTTAEWANVSNVMVGAGVALVVSGGTGEAEYTPPAPVKAEGFRYLDLTIGSSDPGKTFTVEIGSKTWSFSTGSGSGVVRIDLCGPHNAAVVKDGKTSRYPLDAPGTGDPVDSTFWGVSVIEGITLSGLEDGQTYTVGGMELKAIDTPTVSFLSSFANWLLAWNNASVDNTYHKPFFWGNADGRVADQPDIFFVDLTAPVDYYAWQSLNDLKGTVNGLGGWNMVDGGFSEPADGYHTRDRDAYWLCGAGATYDYDSDTWEEWIDRNVAGLLTLPAQPGWDVIQTYGGAGNVFGTGAYAASDEDRTVLAVNKFLRARAWGLVFDLSQNPNSGVSVKLKQDSDSSIRGTGTSGSGGFYKTGTPYGHGNLPHTVEAETETLSITSANRMMHRAVFSVLVASLGLHLCGSPNTGLMFAVGSGETLKLYKWAGATGVITEIEIDPDPAESAQIAVTPHETLVVVFDRAGSVYRTWSGSHGKDWSTPVLITTGNEPAIAVHEATGAEFIVVWENEDFVCKKSVDGGVTWTEVGTVVTAEKARGGLEFTSTVDNELVFVLDGVRRFYSTNFGEDWIEV